MKTLEITDLKKNFKDPKILDLALTHRSWVNENKDKASSHNERLEFLGDAVLEYVVSSHLYKTFPDKEEGFLTTLRANIVNTKNLSRFAKEAKIGKHLKLSKGETKSKGSENPSLLANTVEAIIGAIYLDQGMENAKAFIHNFLLADLDQKLLEPLKDAKSRLQEIIQGNNLPAPKYHIIKELGPDHDKRFVVEVAVDKKPLASGRGKSKSEAEQEAAKAALEQFTSKR